MGNMGVCMEGSRLSKSIFLKLLNYWAYSFRTSFYKRYCLLFGIPAPGLRSSLTGEAS